MTDTMVSIDEARLQLHDIIRKDVPFDDKAREALELATQCLGADNGHLARVDQETDYWRALVTTDLPDAETPPDLERDLQDTYCRQTIEDETPYALHNAPDQGWADDPAFETRGLHTYLGTTLIVDDEPYGTVCFVAEEPRSEPFSDTETRFAEHLTRLLERELECERVEAKLTKQTNFATVLNRVLRHNLRNDISVIRGYTEFIAEQLDDEPTVETVLDHIDDLIDLSEKARDLEQIITASSERHHTEIGPLIEDIVGSLGQKHPAASFSVDYDDGVHVDVLQNFDQAVEELIENAVKHSGDSPTVTVTVDRAPNAVEVQISDDGPGLPDNEVEALEAGAETPLTHGSGVGLWMAQWIVTNHDGSLDPVVTENGTTLTITIPRKAAVGVQEQLTELTRSRDKYKATFEEAADAIVIVNDDGRIMEANPGTEAVFGMESKKLVGRSLTEFLSDEFDFDTELQDFQQAGNERDTVTAIRADGDERVLEYSAVADITPGQHLFISRDVTERKERERRYNAIFNQSYQFTGLLEPDGTILEANESVLEFSDLDLEDVVGKQLWETDWWEGDETTQQEIRKAVDRAAEGEFVRSEVELQGNEETTIIDFSIRPITDDRDNVTLLIPEGRDISERKEREQELRQAERRLSVALDAADAGVWEWDIESGEIVWDETMERILGLEPGAFEGTFDAFFDRIHPDDTEKLEANIEAAIEEGGTAQWEIRIAHEDGGFRWIDTRVQVVRDQDDIATRIIGAGIDSTDRKENEQELERAEMVFQNTQDALFLVDVSDDSEFRIRRVNESCEDAMGRTSAELTGKTPREVVGDEVGANIESRYRECVERQETIQYVEEVPVDGDPRFWETKLTPLGKDGSVTQLVGAMRDITERRERERELSMMKGRYETLLEAAPDPVFVADAETGELIEVNEAAETLLGMSSDEITGMHQSEIHPTEKTELYQQFFKEHVESGGPKQRLPDGSRPTIVTTNGERVPVEISVETVSLPDGPVIYGIFRDVSEQIEREQELEETTQRLQLALEGTDTGVWDWTIGTGKVRWSESLERLVGIEPGTFEGTFDAFVEYIHPDDREKATAAVEQAAETESRFQTEYRIQRADGTQVWVESRGEVYEDGDDAKRMVGIVTDITERKEREAELTRKTEAMEKAPVGIGLSDPNQLDNPMVYVNERFCELTGYDESGIIGRNCRFMQGPETNPEPVAEIRDAIDNKEPVSTVLRNYRKDGTVFWNHVTIAPIRDEDGDVSNWVGFQEDATERIARKQQLELAETVFENTQDALFVIDVAEDHEFYIERVNEVYEELTGLSNAEIAGKTPTEAVGEEIGSEIESQYRKCVERRETIKYPEEIPVDGEQQQWETKVTPVISEGRVDRLVGAMRDVTSV